MAPSEQKDMTSESVCPVKASTAALEFIEDRFEDKSFRSLEAVNSLPRFERFELKLGKRLGAGAFSVVEEITQIAIKDERPLGKSSSHNEDDQSVTEHEGGDAMRAVESRRFISRHCKRASGDARYALKVLRRDVMEDQDSLTTGLCDLIVETRFLSRFEHPNIIKLRALSAGDPFSCPTGSYFLILDRLYDTLQQRLLVWRKESKQPRFKAIRRFIDATTRRKSVCTSPKPKSTNSSLEDRIATAHDISSALTYLHHRKIIHRDIKPENLGFDVRNDIKIFDLGMARQLPRSSRRDDGTYILSGMTGTLRYMAPEVAVGLPYHQCCDVYSFTILLWEMLALEQPYHSMTSKEMFIKEVFKQNKRPLIKEDWSLTLQDLLETNWHPDLKQRHTMDEIQASLCAELITMRQGDDTGLSKREIRRRRSTFVFGKLPLIDFSSNELDFFSKSMESLDGGLLSRDNSVGGFLSRECSESDTSS